MTIVGIIVALIALYLAFKVVKLFVKLILWAVVIAALYFAFAQGVQLPW